MIVVRDVSKRFKSGRGTVQALAGVTFDVERGSRMAIVGKSGSGKSTLLNILGGLEKPDSGSVHCFGTDIHALPAGDLSRFLRRRAGFVFQHGNLLSYLNVAENIGFPLTLNGIVGVERQKRIEELLERIGLPGTARAHPFELSGGELQRVSIARAMAHRPELLLADEPTASLDSATGHDLVELLFGLGKHGCCTVLVSTHDMEILKLADRSIRMRDGKIVDD